MVIKIKDTEGPAPKTRKANDRSKTIKKTRKKSTRHINWHAVKRKWITMNCRLDRAGTYTLIDAANHFDIAHGTVQNRASKEKWNQQLEDHKERKAAKSIEFVMNADVINEAEIRLRQMNVARLSMKVACEKLETLSAKDFTVSQMIELLKLGLTEERKAVGMSDKVEFVGTLEDNRESANPIFTTAKANGLLGEILDMVEEQGTHILKELAAPQKKVR